MGKGIASLVRIALLCTYSPSQCSVGVVVDYKPFVGIIGFFEARVIRNFVHLSVNIGNDRGVACSNSLHAAVFRLNYIHVLTGQIEGIFVHGVGNIMCYLYVAIAFKAIHIICNVV